MKYVLLIYACEATGGDRSSTLAEYLAFAEALRQRGVFCGGEGLDDVGTATTVRVRKGKAVHTDGPFADTKEQLGGFFLVDVETETDALALAAEIPGARGGTIEVRAVTQY